MGKTGSMTTVDDIWDRAIGYVEEPTAPGDRALRDVLTFHGTVMNGGLLNAVESYLDDEEYPLDRVVQGYTYLGLVQTAEVITEGRERFLAADRSSLEELEALELDLDPRYEVEDEDLASQLAAKVAAHPGHFAPPSAERPSSRTGARSPRGSPGRRARRRSCR